MRKFNNIKEVQAHLIDLLNISQDEAVCLSLHLFKGMHILWDSGWHCYVWPETLSLDDLYMMLELVQEEETFCPF